MQAKSISPFVINQPAAPLQTQSAPSSQAKAPVVQVTPQDAFRNLNSLKSYVLAQNKVNIQKPDKTQGPAAVSESLSVPGYRNDLRTKMVNNEASILAIIPRTFNAKDTDGNGLIQDNEQCGNFMNAIERLDEVKAMGFDTIHMLPIHPPGKTNAMGTAGSIYAPAEFVNPDGSLAIDPMLRDPKNSKNVNEQCAHFIKECHKRGIKVMLDLPSCVSLDFAEKYPEMMAREKNGNYRTPQGWRDIRMLEVWSDLQNRILNPHLLELHKKYIDACISLGFDGIRADVARAKSMEFWNVIIPYSRAKDPEFAWLAETYTYEDASPQLNMPHDRPFDQLKAGFDSYYGQYHIFHQWTKAPELHNYVKENIDVSNANKSPKSLIASFATHDDMSLMFRGGVPWVMTMAWLQALLPQMNTYHVDGSQSGDYYLYPYDGAINPATMTDNEVCTVHKGKLDIFNFSRKPGGIFPVIGEHIKKAHETKEKYKDLITKGSYIPLTCTNPEIIAFARHQKGKTVLAVMNRNVNFRTSGTISIPGFSKDQPLNDIVLPYGQKSYFQKADNALTVDLSPSRIYVFEVNTPGIEENSPEVYKQDFGARSDLQQTV